MTSWGFCHISRCGSSKRFDHFSQRTAGFRGDVSRVRRPPQSLSQPRLGSVHLQCRLLHAPRNTHGPSSVAKVALQFARDRGPGESLKHASFRVEPRDGLDQPDRRHLFEVFAVDPPALEACGHTRGQLGMTTEDLVAAVRVAACPRQQLFVEGFGEGGRTSGQASLEPCHNLAVFDDMAPPASEGSHHHEGEARFDIVGRLLGWADLDPETPHLPSCADPNRLVRRLEHRVRHQLRKHEGRFGARRRQWGHHRAQPPSSRSG